MSSLHRSLGARGLILAFLVCLTAFGFLPIGVTANLPPIADAGADQTVRPGELVFFGAGGSSDPDGDHLSYSWDFDASDGLSPQSVLLAPTHTYAAPGTMVVTLTVSDGSANATDTAKVTVIANRAPVIALPDQLELYVGEQLTDVLDMRNVSDPDNDPLTLAWDFDDDGETDSSDREPDQRWTAAGTYPITLSATDGHETTTKRLTIVVIYGEVVLSGNGPHLKSGHLLPHRSIAYAIKAQGTQQLTVAYHGTSGSGGLATLYLLPSVGYRNYRDDDQVTSTISRGSRSDVVDFEYEVELPSADTYYVVILNGGDHQLNFTLGARLTGGSRPTPGMEALPTLASIVLAVCFCALRRRSGGVAD